jgi:hypothetical protein
MLAETVQNVADVINAGTYSSAITAAVTWVPKPDDKDPGLECYVWCEDATYNRETRCPSVRFEGTVKVAVREAVSVDVQSDVTSKISLVEEVIDQLNTVKVFNSGATFDSISWFNVYDTQALYEDSIFVSIFSIDVRSIV